MMLCHLIKWYVVIAFGFWWTNFKKIGCRVQVRVSKLTKGDQGIGMVRIVESVHLNDNASCYWSWMPLSSRVNSSSLKKLVPILICQVVGMTNNIPPIPPSHFRKALVLACIDQQCLGQLACNHAMCHWETRQYVSIALVICAISWSLKWVRINSSLCPVNGSCN